MPITDIGDPRLKALFGASDPRDAGVRPTVRLPRKGLPPIALAIGAAIAAVLLFLALDTRRTAQQALAVRAPAVVGTVSGWEEPPALYVPPVPQTVLVSAPATDRHPASPVAVPKAATPMAPSTVTRPAYITQPLPQLLPPPAPLPPRASSGSALVIDTGSGPATGSAPAAAAGAVIAAPGQGPIRVRASAFANRSTTVPQGHLIPAVLETGFNSTQPGYARAIVARDVRSFDGTNVLIPRGSRLIGEYRSATDQTQKRAIIIWTRLIRPDGMTIAMDSPAVDTLGRGGVPASANTHFFQRLGDALLQTTVDLGRAVAGRAVTGPVVILSGGTQSATPQLAPAKSYVPTLSVPAGKSISVFVAHDLDFGSASSRP